MDKLNTGSRHGLREHLIHDQATEPKQFVHTDGAAVLFILCRFGTISGPSTLHQLFDLLLISKIWLNAGLIVKLPNECIGPTSVYTCECFKFQSVIKGVLNCVLCMCVSCTYILVMHVAWSVHLRLDLALHCLLMVSALLAHVHLWACWQLLRARFNCENPSLTFSP